MSNFLKFNGISLQLQFKSSPVKIKIVTIEEKNGKTLWKPSLNLQKKTLSQLYQFCSTYIIAIKVHTSLSNNPDYNDVDSATSFEQNIIFASSGRRNLSKSKSSSQRNLVYRSISDESQRTFWLHRSVISICFESLQNHKWNLFSCSLLTVIENV